MPPEGVVAGAIGAAQVGSTEATGLTAAIGVGAGRGAAGLNAAGFATLGADFLATFFAAFLAGARFALTARLALRFGARRATTRFLPFAFAFFFTFLFFLAISSSPEQVCSRSVRFHPTLINLHERTPFAKYGVHGSPARDPNAQPDD